MIRHFINCKLVQSKYLFSKVSTLNTLNLKYFTSQEVKKDIVSESEALEIIEAGVFEVLKGAAKCQHDKLSRAALLKDIGFDSLDQVELVVAMEEKFNVNITDDDSLKIQSVLDAIQIMHKAFISTHCNVGTQIEVKEENIPKV